MHWTDVRSMVERYCSFSYGLPTESETVLWWYSDELGWEIQAYPTNSSLLWDVTFYKDVTISDGYAKDIPFEARSIYFQDNCLDQECDQVEISMQEYFLAHAGLEVDRR